jgi:DNA-nicking Smr family endonuclease
VARKRRPLSPEDEDLWQRVAKTARPLNPTVKLPLQRIRTTQPKGPPNTSQPEALPFEVQAFTIGSRAVTPGGHDLAPSVTDHLNAAPLNMDKKTFQRLKRGKSRPDARLDLHGMTLDQAQGALFDFIPNARARGHRLVLVITGKGRNRDGGGPIPERMGVLRHQVPRWLTGPALGAMVQQVTPAHARHGGSGALYVYLRR